jgi:uncharacterized membrane protein HdeD (DUF308 family)
VDPPWRCSLEVVVSNLVPLDDGLKQIAAKVWYLPVVRGVLALVFGVVTLAWPTSSGIAIMWVIGAFALVDGIAAIVEALRYSSGIGRAVRLVVGALGVVFGLILLLAPVKSALVLVWVIGFWAIVGGLVQTVAALAARAVPGSGWGWSLAAGLATLLFGVLVLVNVQAGALAILWLIGWYAIVVAVLLVALGLQIRAVGKRL